MDSSKITYRLLSSFSADYKSSVNALLLAFGITNTLKTTIPVVFNPKYEAEWRTFIEGADFAAPDHSTRMLFTILEFIRYMRYIRKNPFIETVTDPSTKLRLNIDKVYTRLISEEMNSLKSDLSSVVRKCGLPSQFDLKSVKVYGDLKGSVATLTDFVTFKPRNPRMSLDAAIKNLKGSLYPREVPFQLLERTQPNSTKSSLPKVSNLVLSKSSTVGWFPLAKDKKMNMYITRAADKCLVLRTSVSFKVYIDLGKPSAASSFLIKSWKSA